VQVKLGCGLSSPLVVASRRQSLMQDNLTRNSLNLPTTKIIVKLYDKTYSTADQQIFIMSNEKRTVQSAQDLSVLDKQLEIDSRLGYSRSSNGLGYETTFKSPNPQGSCSVIVEDCSNVPEDPNISSGALSGSLGVNSGAKRLGVGGSSASLGVLENKTVSSGSATGNPRNKVRYLYTNKDSFWCFVNFCIHFHQFYLYIFSSNFVFLPCLRIVLCFFFKF